MIEIQNLTKHYGEIKAVEDVNFTVEKGEILGFLGPNGAGKTTTMNIITGYIPSTSGTVKVSGYDIMDQPREVKRRIGYMPEHPPLYMDMTVKDYLDFSASLKEVDKKTWKSQKNDIMELVKITHVQHRLIRNLSKGYRQRVGLAQALVGAPEVLILDEPTVGLDPKQIIEIRKLIKALGKTHTIILSSHILPEVSAVCERVVIINKGKIVAVDTPEQHRQIDLLNVHQGGNDHIFLDPSDYHIRDPSHHLPLLDILLSDQNCIREPSNGHTFLRRIFPHHG
jgi:ABC-2 type transport system ATP-binding protein